MHQAEINMIGEVINAAEHGAIIVAADRPDIIEEVRSEVALRWRKRIAAGTAPTDPKAWAYVCESTTRSASSRTGLDTSSYPRSLPKIYRKTMMRSASSGG